MTVIYNYPIVDLYKKQIINIYGSNWIYSIIDNDERVMMMLKDELSYKAKQSVFLLLDILEDNNINVITSIRVADEKTILATVVTSIPPPDVSYISNDVIDMNKAVGDSIYLDKDMNIVTTGYKTCDVFKTIHYQAFTKTLSVRLPNARPNNPPVNSSLNEILRHDFIYGLDNCLYQNPICLFDLLLLVNLHAENKDDRYGYVLGRIDKDNILHMFSKEIIKITSEDAKTFSQRHMTFSHVR